MKALVLHQNVEKAKCLVKLLGIKEGDCTFARSRSGAKSVLTKQAPDVVLMNWQGFGRDIIDLHFEKSPNGLVVIIDNAPDSLLPPEHRGKAVIPAINKERWGIYKPQLVCAS